MSGFSRRDFIRLGIAGAAGLGLGPSVLRAMEIDLAGASYNYSKAIRRKPVPFVSGIGKLHNVCQAFVEKGEKVVQVSGHPDHQGTRGRISPAENALHLQAYDPDRILHPLRRTGPRGSGRWKRISWNEAIDEIAGRLRRLVDAGRQGEICLNIGGDTSGGAWTRFMHTLGSGFFARSGAGDANKKVAMLHTWGADIETPDFANTGYILNFGSNIYETFHPFAQTVVEGRVDNRAKMVTFDPRVSMTSGLSDEWFPVIPGTEGLVALAMANVIMQEGLADREFINTWTNVSAEALAAHLEQFTPEMAEERSGVSARDIRRIAVEFAASKPATIFTYRGISSHPHGVYQERACMLLPVITGNVEAKGGYCLPRRLYWDEPEPVPPAPKGADPFEELSAFPLGKPRHLLPFLLKDGLVKVGVLFNYHANPAYSAPGAGLVREVLKDETLVPFLVDFSPFMSETALLADIILPDALSFERSEPDTSPSSLLPWFGIRQPAHTPPGESREVRMVLRDIIHRLDPDGGRDMKKFWEFEDAEDWMRRHFDNVPGLDEEGGYDAIVEQGVWPIYGTLDPATKKIVDEEGRPVEADYGLYRRELRPEDMAGASVNRDTGLITKGGRAIGIRIKGRNYRGFNTPSRRIEIFVKDFERKGFEPLPVWKGFEREGEKGLVLITFKSRYHSGSSTANNKFLAEMSHSNPVWINARTARERGIGDGALVRVSTAGGYMVTRAHVTNAIHPQVVAISFSCGHRAYGRVARAGESLEIEQGGESHGADPDVEHNLWWDDRGVHPNDIIPPVVDPIGGGQGWNSIAADVSPAAEGDRYGDIRADNSILFKHYKKLLEGASRKD